MTTNHAFKIPHGLSAVLPPDARIALARAAHEAASIKDQFAREMHMDAIARALHLGFPLKFIEAEPDLVALRRDPGYHAD